MSTLVLAFLFAASLSHTQGDITISGDQSLMSPQVSFAIEVNDEAKGSVSKEILEEMRDQLEGTLLHQLVKASVPVAHAKLPRPAGAARDARSLRPGEAPTLHLKLNGDLGPDVQVYMLELYLQQVVSVKVEPPREIRATTWRTNVVWVEKEPLGASRVETDSVLEAANGLIQRFVTAYHAAR